MQQVVQARTRQHGERVSAEDLEQCIFTLAEFQARAVPHERARCEVQHEGAETEGLALLWRRARHATAASQDRVDAGEELA
ncbi:hypothetical protein LMG28138_06130 [Pararobbsia alpina]|uniref:Uncharacterized protein n=1 Tax=Pararobbsia alpina TaxID=621374 RepID=A0A6S7BQY0_9BURK|nr:hypothetical protein LMG28138_06130 [Pararobbsia alpina]